jgi:hypothetical protein
MKRFQELLKAVQVPGAFLYLLPCLGALVVIFLVLVQQGYWVWSLLPVLAGLVAGMTRFGPFMLPLALALLLHAHRDASPTPLHAVPNLVLYASVLVYVLAHFRLQALVVGVFPPLKSDTRGPRRRSAGLVSAPELGSLLFVVPLVTFLAPVVWAMISGMPGNPGLQPDAWKAICLAWFIGIAFFLAVGYLDLVHRRQMTVEEARLLLQDTLWQETRGEQRNINRWLAWARLRQQRRKDRRS